MELQVLWGNGRTAKGDIPSLKRPLRYAVCHHSDPAAGLASGQYLVMAAEFDLPTIAQRMLALGIMDKPFRDMSREEVLELCLAIHTATKRRSLQPVAPSSPGTVPGQAV